MKSTTKQDLQNPNIPKYMYNPHTKKIEKWDYIERFGFTWHHKIAQQLIRRCPELQEQQVLYYLPTLYYYKDENGIERQLNMHGDLHARNRNFKNIYGIDIEELLYKER